MFHFRHSSVWSLLLHADHKVSRLSSENFTFSRAAAAAELLGSSPGFLIWQKTDRGGGGDISENLAGLRPPSSLRSVTGFPSHVFALQTSLRGWSRSGMRLWSRLASDWKPPQGSSTVSSQLRRMKSKCCHLHIFLVESGEKREKHFGEHFKLGMCLFPGPACLALNEIQSLCR